MKKVSIFGSCVSRDTCELWTEAEVFSYTARQSMTSLISPRNLENIDTKCIESNFQRRMVEGDLLGNGISAISAQSHDVDLVLVDIIDERRGYWLWPNGATATNSVEVEYWGITTQYKREGARLIRFGTNEHYRHWRRGLEIFLQQLDELGLLERSVFLNIEWAMALDGSPHPKGDLMSTLGKGVRRIHRIGREARRAHELGSDTWTMMRRSLSVGPTESEKFVSRARAANARYEKYYKAIEECNVRTVLRRSSEVRIAPTHKWGPQPFHYRDEDYRSFIASIKQLL